MWSSFYDEVTLQNRLRNKIQKQIYLQRIQVQIINHILLEFPRSFFLRKYLKTLPDFSSSVLSFIYLSKLFFQFLHRRSVLCSSQIQVQLLHLFASSHEHQLWQQIHLYQLGSKGEILNQAILILR